jgi:hypothetical protein
MYVPTHRWVPYSIQKVDPLTDKASKSSGTFGTLDFNLHPTNDKGQRISAWHDIPLLPSPSLTALMPSFSSYSTQLQKELLRAQADTLFNFVVEIPMYSTAKMEVIATLQP